MSLKTYRAKRNFAITAEPAGKIKSIIKKIVSPKKQLKFVVQKHNASHLHYDFRLEMQGVLKSWAVPKGPSLDPSIKRLAVEVEDHPLEYGNFEGIIPENQYGAGIVMLWDRGYWQAQEPGAVAGYKKGHIAIELFGEKLKGKWALVKIKSNKMAGTKNPWLLMKLQDKYAKVDYDILAKKPRSVISKRTTTQIGMDPKSKKYGKNKTSSTKPIKKKSNSKQYKKTKTPSAKSTKKKTITTR